MANSANKPAGQETIQEVDKSKAAKVYKIIKNVKFGDQVLKIGERVEIPDEDLEEFKSAGAVQIDE